MVFWNRWEFHTSANNTEKKETLISADSIPVLGKKLKRG